ncbi:MAG: chemotaxis protein CheD [Clostridiales Family XIII bacterium]|jgi:chemotaxis protein CheD|nr:chemotaxis protein CheD [Clostridiales Family XIII bacterium]
MDGTIPVGISDYKTSRSPDTLVTYALGSCVGISLYDPRTKIGGLSHIMLPSSLMRNGKPIDDRMKYADTAIEDMFREMLLLGARRDTIMAKIAGGANMFHFTENSLVDTIGDRNIDAVHAELSRLCIPLVGEDVGENYGRTVYFNLGDGKLKVQSIGKNMNEL